MIEVMAEVSVKPSHLVPFYSRGYAQMIQNVSQASSNFARLTDDNVNAMFQSVFSKLFKKKPHEDTVVPPL